MDDTPKRLDRLILQLLPGIPRVALLKALRTGRIRLNGKKSPGETRVQLGDQILVEDRLWEEGRSSSVSQKSFQGTTKTLEPQEVLDPRWIIFENQDLLVLNKPRGWDTQGDRSLDTLVKAYLGTKVSLSFRPGPLHRLDTNTSGILCFSCSLSGAQNFSRMLQSGALTKYYLALVKGDLKAPRIVESPLERDQQSRKTFVSLEGKPSRTTFQPLKRGGGFTLVLCKLDTGRTHQIRVQAQEIGHPLAGDGRYEGGPFPGGFILHAWTLVFPSGGIYTWPQVLQCPLPKESRKKLMSIFSYTKEELEQLLDPSLPLRLLS